MVMAHWVFSTKYENLQIWPMPKASLPPGCIHPIIHAGTYIWYKIVDERNWGVMGVPFTCEHPSSGFSPVQ